MSQSDYLKYKKMSTLLKYDKIPPVMSQQYYIDCKQYQIETTIPDTKMIENSLLPEGSTLIFDMLKVVSSCPTFPTCTGTNARTNRVPMSSVYFTPKYVQKYVKQRSYEKNACDCILNSVYTKTNVCACKTKFYLNT